ncbi:orc1/cdc6 family replication initiation protein, partial [Candidatus Bathyarchaeota archaeon]|nr:orc1/cdc6 family replication initiation protein [Candidatus Bathyarchaeota archaeon]
MERYFESVLREGVSAKVHIHGPIGSGKTVLCKSFGRDLEAKAAEQGVNLRFARINLAYT